MKLLHCIHSLDPKGGGPAEFVKALAEHQQALGIDLTVLTLDTPQAPWLQGFPAAVHALGPGSQGYGFSPRLVPWLKTNVQNFDLVVISGIWQYSSFGTYLALKETSTPYVLFTHGMLDPWFKKAYPLKHVKKSIYWFLAERHVLKNARAVLFTSQMEKEQARLSFPCYQANELVVPYGTSGPPPNKELIASEFFKAFPKLKDQRFLLFLGRIHEKKGVDMLLHAFSRCAAYDTALNLVIAGPCADHYAETLKRDFTAYDPEAAKRVFWTGMLSGNLKWGALYCANALVLPSHQENFARVVAEALSCDTPVLISKQVNIWQEILADGAGLVEVDTQEGTDKLLSDWLKLPAKQSEEMRQNAQRSFLQRYEFQSVAKQLVDIFGDFASERFKS